jgi:hypothetical protein
MDGFRAIAHIDPDGTGSLPAVFDRRDRLSRRRKPSANTGT